MSAAAGHMMRGWAERKGGGICKCAALPEQKTQRRCACERGQRGCPERPSPFLPAAKDGGIPRQRRAAERRGGAPRSTQGQRWGSRWAIPPRPRDGISDGGDSRCQERCRLGGKGHHADRRGHDGPQLGQTGAAPIRHFAALRACCGLFPEPLPRAPASPPTILPNDAGL